MSYVYPVNVCQQRHHFRELSVEAQRLLGPPAENFTDYWVSRFPLLLPHSWTAMQCVRHEPLFVTYYHGSYTFPMTLTDGSLPAWWYEKKSESSSSMKSSPVGKNSPKHSRRDRRGSDLLKIYEDGSPLTSSPKNSRKSDLNSVKGLRIDVMTQEEKEQDAVDKENWMRSGQEKGVFRPRMRRRSKKQNEQPQAWSVPP